MAAAAARFSIAWFILLLLSPGKTSIAVWVRTTVPTPTLKAAVRESWKAVCRSASILLKGGVFRRGDWILFPIALPAPGIDCLPVVLPVLNALCLNGFLVSGVVTF